MSVETLINIVDSIIIIGMNGSTCVYMLADDLMQAAIEVNNTHCMNWVVGLGDGAE